MSVPATTQTHHQGLGFRDLNEDDDADADDCAELDCEEDSSDLFGDSRRVADLNSFGNDFGQSASDHEEDTTINLVSEVSEFQVTPPPSQRRRLSIDPHDIHAAHVQFWTSGIREDYANRLQSSQQVHTPSSHNSFTPQSTWLQGLGA